MTEKLELYRGGTLQLNMEVQINISVGELIDKITILQIKTEKIKI